MSSFFLLIAGLLTYFGVAQRTRNMFAPCALMCLFWFVSAAIADMASLKDPSLQRPWELETYGAIFLSGLSVFTVGFLGAVPSRPSQFVSNPSIWFRRVLDILFICSIAAVALRLYLFGFSPEKLLMSMAGGDIKAERSDAIPGVHYFEILTPYLCLCALYELHCANNLSPSRRRALKWYAFYAIALYCVVFSASRGTLLIVISGAMFLYAQSGRLKSIHLIFLGCAVVALMSALSFLRMSAGTVANSFLGDQALQTFFSPIYTYVAFNFENLNSLIRSDTSHTYVFYSLKFLLWPFLKNDYESGLIRLTNFDTLFFNARTYLYPFYHDLGIFGCVLYPTLIALLLVKLQDSASRDKSKILMLMGLQKPIWFAFFGNYFFGELVLLVPLLVMYILSLLYRIGNDAQTRISGPAE